MQTELAYLSDDELAEMADAFGTYVYNDAGATEDDFIYLRELENELARRGAYYAPCA